MTRRHYVNAPTRSAHHEQPDRSGHLLPVCRSKAPSCRGLGFLARGKFARHNDEGKIVMPEEERFSVRHGFSGSDVEITIREDAPESLRYWVQRAATRAGMSSHSMRAIVCESLRRPPDRNNWSDGNVYMEVESLLFDVPGFECTTLSRDSIIFVRKVVRLPLLTPHLTSSNP